MSYPLVQFSSDTLSSIKDVSGKDLLKVHLVELMLTALADVTLCCDVKPVHELYNHYKVLYNCLNVLKLWLKPAQGDAKHVLVMQLVLGLLRPFHIVINRYIGSKVNLLTSTVVPQFVQY